MSPVILQFSPGDQEGNLKRLLESEGLKSLANTPVISFGIFPVEGLPYPHSQMESFDYELATLLLYLNKLFSSSRSDSGRVTFKMNHLLRRTIIDYYGRHVCQRNIGAYPGIAALLAPGTSVQIRLKT